MLAPRLFMALATLVVLTVAAYRVGVVEPGAPVHMPAGMRFTTPCVSSSASLTQSFRIETDAINGVTVVPSVTGPAAGQLRYELREGDSPSGVVRYASSVSLRDLVSGAPTTLRLPRVARTPSGAFTLRIDRTDDGGCLAFLASAVHAPEARLLVGGREVYGDLLFQIHADRGTILHGVQDWLAHRTGVMMPMPLLISCGVVYGLAIALFGQWLVMVRDRAAA